MEKIIYGFYPSSLGEMVLGKTEKGLCWLGFMVAGYKGDGLERMRAHFKGAEFVHDDDELRDLGDQVMEAWAQGRENEIALDLHGSVFQKAVWKALLKIRKGQKLCYGDVANDIGRPAAARAV